MITEQSHVLLQLYSQYLKGNYLVGGGFYQQPNAYVQSMEILSVS